MWEAATGCGAPSLGNVQSNAQLWFRLPMMSTQTARLAQHEAVVSHRHRRSTGLALTATTICASRGRDLAAALRHLHPQPRAGTADSIRHTTWSRGMFPGGRAIRGTRRVMPTWLFRRLNLSFVEKSFSLDLSFFFGSSHWLALRPAILPSVHSGQPSPKRLFHTLALPDSILLFSAHNAFCR